MNISFALTTEQVRRGFEIVRGGDAPVPKDVTRRLGWLKLKAGDRLQACEKCMGRRKGEPLVLLGMIVVASVRRERLDAITDEDVAREGFPGQARQWFIEFFQKTHKDQVTKKPATGATMVTRIEFRYEPPKN